MIGIESQSKIDRLNELLPFYQEVGLKINKLRSREREMLFGGVRGVGNERDDCRRMGLSY